MKQTKGEKILGIVSNIILIAAVIEAVILMAQKRGLIPWLDFGAGAYYYADIPNFQRFTGQAIYHSGTPSWLIFLLFLAWGALMYKFWVFVDRRSRGNGTKDSQKGNC